MGKNFRRLLVRRLLRKPNFLTSANSQRRRTSRQHQQHQRLLGNSRTRNPHTAYCAAKFAVKGFTEALNVDLQLNAPHVTAHVVMPGHIGTSISLNSTEAHGGPNLERIRKNLAERGAEVDQMSDSTHRPCKSARPTLPRRGANHCSPSSRDHFERCETTVGEFLSVATQSLSTNWSGKTPKRHTNPNFDNVFSTKDI